MNKSFFFMASSYKNLGNIAGLVLQQRTSTSISRSFINTNFMTTCSTYSFIFPPLNTHLPRSLPLNHSNYESLTGLPGLITVSHFAQEVCLPFLQYSCKQRFGSSPLYSDKCLFTRIRNSYFLIASHFSLCSKSIQSKSKTT